MADRMGFPKTIQEFMNGYSFKDDKEIYTNGSRLIPTFRVEQALEHYGQEIRNKAIDGFVNAVKKKFPDDRCGIMNIEMIAEQLKECKDGSETTDN